ncbi:MAG: hypothetical protein QOH23_1074, partial [Gaiellaceae bacterium]|nr:hypothetical protein [Gaiellaceae bacterium]
MAKRRRNRRLRLTRLQFACNQSEPAPHHQATFRTPAQAKSYPPGGYRVSVTEKTVEIREFSEGDLETVVEFSLRAWAPVFASVRNVLGDDIFLRLHPDWQASQAE